MADREFTFSQVREDHTIDVTFKPVSVVFHTIMATAGVGGTISPGGQVQVADGADQTFLITPDPGFEIDVVTVDGAPV